MASNCLVTKLKAVVDNSHLPKLGEMLVNVLSSDAKAVITGNNLTVRSSDSVFDVYDNQGTLVGNNVSSYTGNHLDIRFKQVGTCYVSGKYDSITTISLKKCTAVTKYCNAMTSLEINGTYEGVVSDYVAENLAYFVNFTSGVRGSVNDLFNLLSLISLTAGSYSEGGNVYPAISGDFLQLIIAQIGKRRTNGTINGTWSPIFFNNEQMPNVAKYQLAWVPISGTSNYTVTVKAGASLEDPTFSRTITIDANGNIVS